MFSSYFNWLSDLFVGFSAAWEWLTSPMLAEMPDVSGLPDWLGGVITTIVGATPLSILGIGSITILIVAFLLKVIWEAIPIL